MAEENSFGFGGASCEALFVFTFGMPLSISCWNKSSFHFIWRCKQYSCYQGLADGCWKMCAALWTPHHQGPHVIHLFFTLSFHFDLWCCPVTCPQCSQPVLPMFPCYMLYIALCLSFVWVAFLSKVTEDHNFLSGIEVKIISKANASIIVKIFWESCSASNLPGCECGSSARSCFSSEYL